MPCPSSSLLARLAAPWLLVLLLSPAARALQIEIDFDNGYFGDNATARNTILKAAADISAAITSPLPAVDQNVFVGTEGSTSVTLAWTYQYTDPSTGAPITANRADANKVEVRVGDRLFSSGNTLGSGGGSGIGIQVSLGGSSSNIPSQFAAAVDKAESMSEAELRRGNSNAYNRFQTTLSFTVGSQQVSAPLDVRYGVAYGSVGLDIDTNNDGAADTTGQLNNYWHLDYSTPVASGKNDLYSIMLHELLHVLGAGASDSWNNRASGTNWQGFNVEAELGHGNGVLAADGDHVASHLTSPNIVNGQLQQTALSPTITVGTRKYLTALDLAFLRDLGYATITPDFTLAGDYNGDSVVDAADYTVWRNTLGMTGSNLAADGNGDNVVNATDYTVWKDHFGDKIGPGALVGPLAAVPEPSGLILAVVVTGSAWWARRWSLGRR